MKPEKFSGDEEWLSRPVFVSFASVDQQRALDLCKALEVRGLKCWISCRDIEPGQNYQEAIVDAIHGARAMLLQFSKAANNSDEIKKELSLASRFRIPVIAVRIEDVEPSNAFAYELSTRQWLDAFHNWDRGADALVRSIKETSKHRASDVSAPLFRSAKARWKTKLTAASFAIAVAGATGGWYLVRTTGGPTNSRQVRLAGFERLSTGLPATMPDALREELVSVFSNDAVVTASTAAAPPPGNTPAYAVAGALRRVGGQTELTVRFVNERTGANLWSGSFTFEAKDDPRVPRWAAVRVSRVIRCGIFAASTYPKPLPDETLGSYFGYCANNTDAGGSVRKAVDYATRVTSATPDFSWGWSALEQILSRLARSEPDDPAALTYADRARAAAEKAIRLDPGNGEAYAIKNWLVAPNDLVNREKLLNQAIAARPLAFGLEHHFFGDFLSEVGKLNGALAEYGRAIDVFPLNFDPKIESAKLQIILGRPGEAKEQLDPVLDAAGSTMIPDPFFHDEFLIQTAPLSGDYAASARALETVRNDQLMPPILYDALLAANEALVSGDTAAKERAAAALAALPAVSTNDLTVAMLGALGADGVALQKAAETANTYRSYSVRKALFYPSMSRALRDRSFPAVAQRLGLMTYWKTTHTVPDVCLQKDRPPFCEMI